MSLEALTVALSKAAAQIKPGHAHYRSLFKEDGITPHRHLPNWLIDPVRQEIENTPELTTFAAGWIQSGGSGQRLTTWHVAQALVYRLFAGADPKQTVTDIVDLAQQTAFDAWIYVGLYGGGIQSEIKLAPNIAVMPSNIAPPSSARELIFGVNRWGQIIHEDGLPRWKPNLALLITEKVEIFREDMTSNSTLLRSVAERAQQAVRALILAGEHPFVMSWQTSWLAHPALPYEGFGGWGAGGPLNAIPQPQAAMRADVNPESAKKIYTELSLLKPDVRQAVGLATDRLGRSRTHLPSADTALDLGIASEIILLHGSNDSELRYRFATNGAFLLGSSGDDRLAKFKSLNALYSARSQAAHTGTLDAKWVARLAEFDALCSDSIRAIIDRQDFPDWQQLILGNL